MADEATRAVRAQFERIPPRLAAEALDEASARARELLVERLTAVLVAEAERCLIGQAGPDEAAAPAQDAAPAAATPEPEPAPEREPAAPAPEGLEQEAATAEPTAPEPVAVSEGETGCYLFAIARAGGPPLPSIQGMDGSRPVREVVSGQLAGIVCEIPLSLFDGLDQEAVGPESRLAQLARRHDEVVRATFERRAVLPLRFGTVLTSEQRLVAVLGEQQSPLAEELRRLEGKAEWTCRIQPEPAAPATRREPSSMGGAAYLAERERELAATAEADPYGVAAAADRVGRAAEAHVESARPPDPAGEEARISFLVSDGEQEHFADAVAAVAEASPTVRVELLGPHPPYHFASVQLGGEP